MIDFVLHVVYKMFIINGLICIVKWYV